VGGLGLSKDLETYIHISKYARWIEAEKRRETWPETVNRLVNYWMNKFPEVVTKDVGQELFDGIYNKEVMPSMRSLMTAGPALDRDNAAGFNPVVGSTKVLTKEFGYVPIKDLENKEATVLNCNGSWAAASFKSYGEQQIVRLVFRKNSNTKHEVYCTNNHRWLLDSGEVKSTSELLVGSGKDRVPFSSLNRNVNTESVDYKLGCVHGIIFGDGTKQFSQKRLKGYVIRLCEDQEEFLEYFKFLPEVKISYPPSFNGDPVVKLFGSFGKTHDLKSLPDFDEETEDYMVGFIRGWIAADGSVGASSSVQLCLSEEFANWFVVNSARWGYVVQHIRGLPPRTNFGDRTRRTFTITIDRSSLSSEDFLIKRKRDKFIPLISKFTIESKELLDIREKVYCAVVPDTNTFVLERGLVTGNCAGIAVNHSRVFDEIFYLLMCGAGVGFSVEKKYIESLPTIANRFFDTDTVIKVRDSKCGWAKALKELVALLYNGDVPKWDVSSVRPAGARLKTFGGRASGPEPLDRLFKYFVKVFTNAHGRKLNSLECHDLICKIADSVIVGGVRRSATMSVSDLDDSKMARAKNGSWWETEPQRALANNSVAYKERPDIESFTKEFRNLYQSKAGERGIINKVALKEKAESCGRVYDGDYLLNP